MKKRLTAAAIVLFAIVFFFLRKPPIEPDATPPAPASSPVPQVSAPAPSSTPSPRFGTSSTPSVISLIPTVERVRSEIAANPHGHPSSYAVFATDLAERFDSRIVTKEGSERMLQELVDCAESPAARELKPVRDLCLADLRLLAKRRPELAGQVGEALATLERSR